MLKNLLSCGLDSLLLAQELHRQPQLQLLPKQSPHHTVLSYNTSMTRSLIYII